MYTSYINGPPISFQMRFDGWSRRVINYRPERDELSGRQSQTPPVKPHWKTCCPHTYKSAKSARVLPTPPLSILRHSQQHRSRKGAERGKETGKKCLNWWLNTNILAQQTTTFGESGETQVSMSTASVASLIRSTTINSCKTETEELRGRPSVEFLSLPEDDNTDRQMISPPNVTFKLTFAAVGSESNDSAILSQIMSTSRSNTALTLMFSLADVSKNSNPENIDSE